MRPRESVRASSVLVLCDHGLDTTSAIVRTLQRQQHIVVRTVHNVEEALNLLGGATWDAILWAPRGQVLPGPAGLSELRKRQPRAAIIAVVRPDEIDSAAEALDHGATSYLVLGPQTDVVLEAVLTSALSIMALEEQARDAEETSRALEARLRVISELCQEAVFVTTPAGTITEVNRAAEQVVGSSASELLGRSAADLLRPAGVFQKLCSALQNPEELGQLAEWGGAAVATSLGPAIIGVEGFVRQRTGAYVLCNVSAAAVRDQGGQLGQIVLTLAPVPQEAWLSRELMSSHRILDLVLGSVSDAIALVDRDGTITRANKHLAQLAGAPSVRHCVGRPVDELLAAHGRLTELIHQSVARRGDATARIAVGAATARGTVVVNATVAALCHEDDTVTGAIVVLSAVRPEKEGRPRAARAAGVLAALRCIELTRHASGVDDARQALDSLAEWLAGVFDAQATAVTVLHAKGLAITGGFGLPEGIGERVSHASRVALTALEPSGSELVVIPDLEEYMARAEDKQLVSTLLAGGLRACALIPLRVGQDAVGAAFLATSDAARFTDLRPSETRAAVVQVTAFVLALKHRLVAVESQRRAELLAQATADVAAAEDLPQLLAEAARALQRVFDADWAAVHLLDEDGEELEESALASADGQVSPGAAMPADAYRIVWDAIRGTRLIVRGFERDGQQHTAAAVRLRADGEVMGSAIVAWRGEVEVADSERAILERLAAHVAAAVRRLRLYREQASRRSEMEVAAAEALDLEARTRNLLQAAAAAAELTELDEILATLAEAAIRTVGLDEVVVYLADHRASELRGAVRASVDAGTEAFDDVLPLRRGASVYADAALSDAPYLLVPLEHNGDIHEVAFVPLRTRLALVGLLAGSRRISGREITAQDLRLLRALGSIAAVVIDRARVDQLRETMAHSISHELRAPVASIRAYTELVLEEGAGPINEEQRTFLQRAVSVCEYLEQLIQDLLELSKLRAGEIRLHPEPTDLRELLDRILESLRHRIEEMDVEVTINIPNEVAHLFVDRMRLAQILTNLIDNAVKFNYQGGKVEVSAHRENATVVISVTDTGPGIPPEEREAIFQEFYRGKGQAAQSRSGAGLGLAIARRLAELLGGELTVESELGRGSTFSLRLPFRPPPESEPATGSHLEVTAGGPAERTEDTDN